jgi:hypothetical protein
MAGTTTSSSYMATSYGYTSRPSSPSKLRVGSSASHPESDTSVSLLSPPVRPTGVRTSTGMRSETMSYTTPSYTTSSYTTTPSALITQMGYTTLNTDTKTITGSEDTFTRNTITPMSTLRNLKVHRDHLSLRFEMLLLCGRNEPQRLSAQVGVRCLFSPCNCIN